MEGARNQEKINLVWLWISLFVGFLAQLCFTLDINVVVGSVIYVIAACLFLISLSKSNIEGDAFNQEAQWWIDSVRKSRIEWLLILVLLLTASFFRLYRIDSQPLSLWLDESLTGLNAFEIIEGKKAPIWEMTPLDPWRPDWVKTSNVYLYYVVLVFKIFGTGQFGLKMISVLPAIASIIAAYFLFKEISNRPAALLSAFLLAVAQWHVTISRWGWDAVLMCLLQLVSYCFLIRGLKTGKTYELILGGGLIGLCLYTYVASWIAFFIALSYLIARAIRQPDGYRKGLRNFLFFFLSCLLVFAPLGTYYFRHPSDLVVRTSELSLAKTIEDAKSYQPMWESMTMYALMFNHRGDSNASHGFPREPLLDFATSIFFILGLVCCLRFWKTSHNLFALLWFILGIQAGLLSEPSTSPNAYRTLIISPVVYFMAGTGAYLFWTANLRLAAKFPRRNLALVVLAIALLGYITFENYSTYFVRRLSSREVWEEEGRDGRLPIRLKSLRERASVIVVDPLLLWKIVVSNTWFLTYHSGRLFETPFLPANLLMVEPDLSAYDDHSRIVYVFPPVFHQLMQLLLPSAKGELIVSPAGEAAYGILTVSKAELLATLQAADKRQLASIVHKIALLYQNHAIVVAREIGPKEKFLREASKVGFNLARRLDAVGQ